MFSIPISKRYGAMSQGGQQYKALGSDPEPIQFSRSLFIDFRELWISLLANPLF